MKAEKEIEKNGWMIVITIAGAITMNVFYAFVKNLFWMYVIAVIVCYSLLFAKSALKKRAGDKAFKSMREAAVKSAMPWIWGIVYALSITAMIYVMFSSYMQDALTSGGYLGILDAEAIEYILSVLTVSLLLYIFQYSLSRDNGNEEIEKSKREHPRHEHEIERGVRYG